MIIELTYLTKRKCVKGFTRGAKGEGVNLTMEVELIFLFQKNPQFLVQ